MLEENSFPRSLLRRLIFSTPKINQPALNVSRTILPSPVVYKCIPHVKGLTEEFISVLSRIQNVKFAVKNIKTVRNLFSKTKDQIPTSQQSNIVYSIPCKDCQATYVGQTANTLHSRITAHRSSVSTEKNSTALSIHSINTGHEMDFPATRILDKVVYKDKRLFIEMFRIAQLDNGINTRKDIENLSAIYTYLIFFDKQLSSRTNPNV